MLRFLTNLLMMDPQKRGVCHLCGYYDTEKTKLRVT